MKREIICGVYKITSPTGRIYIGKSVNIYSRWDDYRKPFCVKSGGQPFISRSIKKYGFHNHIFEIIEVCEEKHLSEREIYWIAFYKTYGSKMGMNCSLGGEGGSGIKWSKKSKENLSRARMGKYTGENNPNYKNGDKIRGERHFMYGKKRSYDENEKNRLGNKLAWAEIVKSDWYNSEEQKLKRKNAAQKGRETKKNCPIYNSEEERMKRIENAARASKASALKRKNKTEHYEQVPSN